MVPPHEAETGGLLNRAAKGDSTAVNELMGRHRDRLQRMVTVRMDPRLARRIDPSDVVQETMAEASRRLPDYMKARPIAFYPWLRQLAWNRLVDLYRFHVEGAKRSVRRETACMMGLSSDSMVTLAQRLVTDGTSPSRNVLRKELQQRVREALGQLPEPYREVLVMRHLEQLSIKEIAAVMEITEGTAKSRLFRGMEYLHDLLGNGTLGVET